ncbi:MAG: glycosyltransferase family 4 protein [Acidobacteria bacterium]|nr:glycosyltransferase family 4 protein [Acidobacteriota bacterium]
MKPLRISFLLPGPGRTPTGGGKVVFEYANHLARRGYQVQLVYPAWNSARSMPMRAIKGTASYLVRSLDRCFGPERWFPLDDSIRSFWVPTLAARFVPDADVVIATAWVTAEWLTQYPAGKGKKFYLIQSWETWDGPEKRIRATWTAPLHKIVIARWLQELAHAMGEECAYIPNGLDFARFGLDTPVEQRDPKRLMMLYHSHPVKGSADGLAALALIKREVPDVRVTLFGTPEAHLPSWVEYRRLPSQQELRACYNKASIFLSPSRTEGWPLPPAEAMLCGAALVATDIGGHREYAVHQQTALLSPAKSPEKLAENALRLMRQPELRQQIARQGNARIRQFTWQRAVDSLEGLLVPGLPQHRPAPDESLCAGVAGSF